MVLLHNSLLQKHEPEQMSWLAAERAMFCTTRKYVKSISARITSKCCEDDVSQPIKWEIFSILPTTFPLLMWRLMHCSTSYILPWVTEKSQKLKKQALHFTCRALCVDCTMHKKLFVIHIDFWWIFFVCVFFDKIYYPGACFLLLTSAWWFETIENRSCLTRKWRIRAGTELNATIGPLVKTWMLIGCGTTNPWVNTTQKVPQPTLCCCSWFDVRQSQPHAFSQHKKSFVFFVFCFFLQRNIFL